MHAHRLFPVLRVAFVIAVVALWSSMPASAKAPAGAKGTVVCDWHLPDQIPGFAQEVFAMVEFDDGNGPALYATGGDGEFGTAGPVAKLGESGWQTVGVLTGSEESGLAFQVFDDGGGEALYAAGQFTSVNSTAAIGIATWNGTTWSALGSGLLGSGSALAVFDDGDGPALYAGGSFTAAGGVSANYIAKWNGTSWSALGSGLGAAASALAVFDDGGGPALYAGGNFTSAGGLSAGNIAKWDGTSWSALGSGVTGPVNALAVFDDGDGPALYAGGDFFIAGSSLVFSIAKWDGSAWSALGSGMGSIVRALETFDDGQGPALYAGGDFTSAGGASANRIARWDGALWSTIGSGLDAKVSALSGFNDYGPTLAVGGNFTAAGGVAATFTAGYACPSVDLALAAMESIEPVIAGSGPGNLLHLVTVTNNGPFDASGVVVGHATTLAANVAIASTTVNTGTVDATSWTLSVLAAGETATLTKTITVSASATNGTTISSSAALTAVDEPDTDGNNDSAGVTTSISTSADLSVTKTDGVTAVPPGGSVTYTVTASNSGPSDATGVTLSDTFPANLTCTYTSIAANGATGNTASGSSDLSEALSMPAASSVVYTVSCTIAPSATGTLSNTATISSSVTDPEPGNNSATDADTVLTPKSDLSVSATDGVTEATPGGSVTYTVTANNNGPSDAAGVTLADSFPADLTCIYTSIAADGAAGNTTSGSGDLSETLSMPAASSVVYTVSCTISPSATGTLSNTATISYSGTDPEPGNNSATDADTVILTSLVFVDDFESGGTASWSTTVPSSFVLQGLSGDRDEIVIELIVTPSTRGSAIVVGRADSGEAIWRLQIECQAASTVRFVLEAALEDGSWAAAKPTFAVGDHLDLQILWRGSLPPGTRNGEMHLVIDGAENAWLTNLKTSTTATREVTVTGDLSLFKIE